VDLVCLAGFMRLLTGRFLSAFPLKVVNIHPALLPAFPGIHAHRQALQFGVRVSGCTVHFVDEGTDSGPVIIQAAVPVLDSDDEAALSKRIQIEEHRIYPRAIDLIARGKVRVVGRRVIVADGDATGAVTSPPLES
jgi:phosphoribosylglycinamide formyltransferase-1